MIPESLGLALKTQCIKGKIDRVDHVKNKIFYFMIYPEKKKKRPDKIWEKVFENHRTETRHFPHINEKVCLHRSLYSNIQSRPVSSSQNFKIIQCPSSSK